MPRYKRKRPHRPSLIPRVAYTIREFCEAHGLSEGMYHKLKKDRLQPKEMKIGRHIMISHEAAADWRRARER